MTPPHKHIDMPNASYEDTHVRVSNKLAAKISIYYYAALVDEWMIDDVLEEAATRLATHVKDELNKNEGKHS